MGEKVGSLRFDIALRVKFDIKGKNVIEGILENISASGEGIMALSPKNFQAGDVITMEIPVPVQIQEVQCTGQVISCQKHNGDYEIDVWIRDIDEGTKKAIQAFCKYLMPSTRLNTVDYLIQQGEKALIEASKAKSVEGSISSELEAYMNELLSLKYHDALRSFEDVLKIDPENDIAIEGFCYSLAEAVSHYQQAGLDGLAETIKVKAMQYWSPKVTKIAKKSPRITRILLEVIRDILDTTI